MGLKELDALDGLISQAEGRTLMDLAAEAQGQPVVEIGSYLGKSTCYMASAGAFVWAIDLWDLRLPTENLNKARNKNKYAVNFESTNAHQRFLANLKAAGVEDSVQWIKAPSGEVAKAWSLPIAGLFIDGAHSFGSVKLDYESWAKWVRPGGWIAFHDATKEKGGPNRVIEELAKPSGLWERWQMVDRLAFAWRTS